LNDFSNLIGLENVEEQENERYRNVLNRKKQQDEIYQGNSGNKRAREDDGGDNEDNFHGLFDGERKAKNKFSSARSKKGGKPKKRRS
jgi:U3 small nucleolar ribonucleoprotein protein LCP5